jgi:hypothetical protein
VNDLFWNSLTESERAPLTAIGVTTNTFLLEISDVAINGIEILYGEADLDKFLQKRTLVPAVSRIKEIMLLHADNKFERMMAEKVASPLDFSDHAASEIIG